MKESLYSWSEYSFRFKQRAQESNIPKDVVLELLNYAYSLNYRKLPVIFDIEHLSYLTGYRLSYIDRSIRRSNNFYRHFTIPKRNGHTRKISEPLPGLKAIQYWILENILKNKKPNKLNNAYNVGKSIKTNAKYHTQQEIVLNVDIENYFQNIGFKKVFFFFKEMDYSDNVAELLAKLCTLDNGLPQGSPVSPSLSNLITSELDIELLNYCKSNNLKYSRYADDITISGSFKVGKIIKHVSETLLSYDFSINKAKIKVKRPHQRQSVTGLVVNNKISPKKADLKLLRQEIYYIRKFGFVEHVKRKQINTRHYFEHLLGKINYFLFINPDNEEIKEYKVFMKSLKNAID